MSLRAPTPSRSTPTPSTSRQPIQAALEAAAKGQSHVDETFLKNRTLEHTVERLKSTLAAEEARSKDAMHRIQQKWEAEREEWREGCDALQTAHRIAHLETAVELEKERLELLKSKTTLRQERTKLLHRDFRLVMFQVQESKLERRIRELEDEIQQFQEAHNLRIQDREDLETQLAAVESTLKDVQNEKAQIEATLSGLRSEHGVKLGLLSSKAAELDRAILRYDTLKSTHEELKGKHDELQKLHSNATRQLEKWSNLDSRDNEELGKLRGQKVELEIAVKDLENRLEEANAESEAAKVKFSKWKKRLEEYTAALTEANENATLLEAEAQETREQLEAAQLEIQELKARLESEERKGKAVERQATTMKPHRTALSPIPASDSEVEEVPSPIPVKQSSKAKPSSRAKRTAQPKQSGEASDVDGAKSPLAKTRSKSRGHDEESDVVEEVPPPAKKPRAKKAPTTVETEDPGPSKPKPKRGRPKKSPGVSGSDVEVTEATTAPVKKGKSKVPEIIIEEVEEQEQDPPAKRKRKKPDEEDEDIGRKSVEPAPKPKRTRAPKDKPPSRQPSVARATSKVDDSDDDAGAAAQPKKKRKINLFPTAQPQTFDWDHLGQGGGGLNIPTDLSPVKDTDAIPPRSTSRLGSVLGSFSQAGRR